VEVEASHSALVHDYLTQRGGAERVVLSLARALEGAPVYTSLYQPETTFPEFAQLEVRTAPIDKIGLFRRHHRLALPVLAPTFSRLRIPADVAMCSSSGWGHGARVERRKIVYCHAPARWLYQTERYLRETGLVGRLALRAARPSLERWDKRAAATADRYLVNSTETARQVERLYGIEAEIVHPPATVDPRAEQCPVAGLEPGYVLCVSRLLPYKNVDRVIEAFRGLSAERLVVAGEGPERPRLGELAGPNVTVLGLVPEPELRWLYANASGLVGASFEDFGLTPVEAAVFGKPTAALRFGGYLDTIEEGRTGLFFEEPTPAEIRDAVRGLGSASWDAEAIARHGTSFSEERFIERIRRVVDEELAAPR
jgi:glycosyltransferase involved in cell wall biosynthesis